jgi:hypothetical protein
VGLPTVASCDIYNTFGRYRQYQTEFHDAVGMRVGYLAPTKHLVAPILDCTLQMYLDIDALELPTMISKRFVCIR